MRDLLAERFNSMLQNTAHVWSWILFEMDKTEHEKAWHAQVKLTSEAVH